MATGDLSRYKWQSILATTVEKKIISFRKESSKIISSSPATMVIIQFLAFYFSIRKIISSMSFTFLISFGKPMLITLFYIFGFLSLLSTSFDYNNTSTISLSLYPEFLVNERTNISSISFIYFYLAPHLSCMSSYYPSRGLPEFPFSPYDFYSVYFHVHLNISFLFRHTIHTHYFWFIIIE